MCTIVELAGLAISAAGTYLGYQSSVSSYNSQVKSNAATAATVKQSVIDQYAATDLQTQQQAASTSQQKLDNHLDAVRSRAKATVAAGEAGVMGRSVDAQLRDFFTRELSTNQTLDTNFSNYAAQQEDNKASIRTSGQTSINTLPSVSKPSFLDAGLRIASSGLTTYEKAQNRKAGV